MRARMLVNEIPAQYGMPTEWKVVRRKGVRPQSVGVYSAQRVGIVRFRV